ncbi:MAG: protein kinase domain-containing protein, partial [Thermoanaerobaculia bacterium]
MSTAERFGDYLLLRKLTTDSLGEAYRAGKIGAQGIERVVYLRLFNGAGLDREALARALADRAGVHRLLENPHIGEGAEVGRIGDTPYVAYEYISGKSLAELLAETRNRSFPLPVEHALFITERMTFGLTSAYATRHREQRIQHGFLVPDLVLLSNEGEVRVLGFEAGPALRQSLAAEPVRQAYGRCLAPEVTPGSLPASAEDVFSLGALLYELLTGKPLVAPADGNYEPLIDQAMVASDEAPLPPSIRALLKSSLTRREERISDVQQWQQALSRFIAEGQYNPTTFNLAFFMHSLFRSEIESETREIEREKTEQRTLVLPATVIAQRPAGGAVLVPPPATPSAELREARQTGTVTAAPAAHYVKARSRKSALLAAAAVLVVLGGLLVAYLLQRQPASQAVAPQEAASLTATPAVPLPGAEVAPAATDPTAPA